MSNMRIFDSSNESRRVAPSETPNADTPTGKIIDAIKTVYDPEIPVNVYDLGLIYTIDLEDRAVKIDMTLTSANCPEAQSIPAAIKAAVETLDLVDETTITMVWEPAWGKEMMSDEAKLHLGLL